MCILFIGYLNELLSLRESVISLRLISVEYIHIFCLRFISLIYYSYMNEDIVRVKFAHFAKALAIISVKTAKQYLSFLYRCIDHKVYRQPIVFSCLGFSTSLLVSNTAYLYFAWINNGPLIDIVVLRSYKTQQEISCSCRLTSCEIGLARKTSQVRTQRISYTYKKMCKREI